MKGLQTGIPLAVLAAVARAQNLGAGNEGTDVGSAAGIGFDQNHDTKVDNIAQNHQHGSWNVGAKAGWPVRRHSPVGLETGNEGADVGNSYGNSANQGGRHDVTNDAENDQRASLNAGFDAGLRKRQGSQNLNTDIKNIWQNHQSASVNGAVGAGFAKRHYGPNLGAGNEASDDGNDLGYDGNQGLDTDVTNGWRNDQGISANALADAGLLKRTGIESGNEGADVGNAAGYNNNQGLDTDITNDWENDQSASANLGAHAGFFKRHNPFGPGLETGNEAHDSGNAFDASFDQSHKTGITNAAQNHQGLSANAAAKLGGVPVVAKRHFSHDSFEDPFDDVIPHSPVGIETGNEGDDHGNDFGYSNDQEHGTDITNGWGNHQGISGNLMGKAGLKRAFRPSDPAPESEESSSAAASTPASTPAQSSHAPNSQDAACATQTVEKVRTVTQTVYRQTSSSSVATPSQPVSMVPMGTESTPAASSSSVAKPTDPSSPTTPSPSSSAVLEHVPATSTAVVTSKYHKIPVYVPEPSSSPVSSTATPSSSHVPSSTPASSSASVPTSVDAVRHGATPTPSSHAGAVFDGAAGHVTPHTGLVSLFCGVVALLAFVY